MKCRLIIPHLFIIHSPHFHDFRKVICQKSLSYFCLFICTKFFSCLYLISLTIYYTLNQLLFSYSVGLCSTISQIHPCTMYQMDLDICPNLCLDLEKAKYFLLHSSHSLFLHFHIGPSDSHLQNHRLQVHHLNMKVKIVSLIIIH